MKIKASAIIEYDTQEVLSDLRKDYPDQQFDINDARAMIHQWIKDDFHVNDLITMNIEEYEDGQKS
jgi:hypothetical protein